MPFFQYSSGGFEQDNKTNKERKGIRTRKKENLLLTGEMVVHAENLRVPGNC